MDLKLLENNMLKITTEVYSYIKEYIFPFLDNDEFNNKILCLTGRKAGSKIEIGPDVHKYPKEWFISVAFNRECKLFQNKESYISNSRNFTLETLRSGIKVYEIDDIIIYDQLEKNKNVK